MHQDRKSVKPKRKMRARFTMETNGLVQLALPGGM
jgi:hypothetical protein